MSIKIILVDISDTLVEPNGQLVRGSLEMLIKLNRSGISVFLVSNKSNSNMKISEVAHLTQEILTPSVVGGRKGTGKFVNYIAEREGLERSEILYLGDTEQDMWECSNSDVLFLRADWSKNSNKTRYGIRFTTPESVAEHIIYYFSKSEYWYFELNGSDNLSRAYEYKALFNSHLTTITYIKHILKGMPLPRFKDDHRSRAKWFLVLHFIASLYLSGYLTRDKKRGKPILCIYPGHRAQQSGFLSEITELIPVLSNSVEFIPDLLIRHAAAPKSALLRKKGGQPTFYSQISTIHLAADYRSKIEGRRVIILDDFTTQGYGFEAARNQFLNGGAGSVCCIAIGKFGYTSTICIPDKDVEWDSFCPNSIQDVDFLQSTVRGIIKEKASIVPSNLLPEEA